MIFTGACLCNAVLYEISPSPNAVADYCHCRECQLASGAPVIAWLQVKPDAFRVTRGTASHFASSARATRWFCANCGTHLFMTDTANTSVGITLASLDSPAAIHPTVHGWESERIAWFDTKDELPRYSCSPPYDF